MIYQLSFRDPLGGGSVHSGRLTQFLYKPYDPISAFGLYSYKQVTFLIHGFNVEEDEGRNSLSEMANHLPSAYPGAVVFVLWPGDSPIGPLSYPFTEGKQANDTAFQIARSIEDHVAPGTSLNFIAHSLGCRVTMETVTHLYQMEKHREKSFPVNNVCLMAPAIDDFSLSSPDNYKGATEWAGRVTVLSSVEDEVLSFIYPIGDLVQAFIYFWEEKAGMALGYHGPVPFDSWEDKGPYPVPKNVYPIKIPKEYEIDHGDYLPSISGIKKEQRSAAEFANALIGGEKNPPYILNK